MSEKLMALARLRVAGRAARSGLLALSGWCLAACSQPLECSNDALRDTRRGDAQQELARGTDVADAGGVLLRAVPEAPAPVECTGIQLTADWYVTAGHCADFAPHSQTHPSLDITLAPGAIAGAGAPLPIYLGDLPDSARVLAYATNAHADPPLEVGRVVEGKVLLDPAGGTYVNAEVEADGPSVCEGDSGSGLFVDSDQGPLLLGVLSSSAAASGELCTPTKGQEYWVRLTAARAWLEQQIGPCEEGLSDAGPYCVFPERAPDSTCL